jgi:uncharacterized membrane protein YheB (UPF0754 family)
MLAAAAHGGGSLLVLLSMPLVASFIGFTTKLVAIEMMFRPIRFRGLRPPLGWQGMVPRRAAKMAGIAIDTLMARLLRPQELLDRIDADELVAALAEPLEETIEEAARELVAVLHPGLWERLPGPARQAVVGRVRAAAPQMVDNVLGQVRDDIDSVIDLRHVMTSNLVRDKRLLNRLFREMAAPELRFIARSGLYFGLAIGCLQAVVWATTHEELVMPLFGLFVGWTTDWLALKMVFRPTQERVLLGPLRWHGRFHRRRHEVTEVYGDMLTREILTPRLLLDAMLNGPAADRLFAMVERAAGEAIDAEVGVGRPVVTLTLGTARYEQLKQKIARRAIERIPETAAHLEAYAESRLDVRNTVVDKMHQLTTDEYEGILRPVFKEDEKILIAVGALLGFLVGELQVVLVTHL